MTVVNQYLATVPFDLYELHLLQLVARHGSFTRAAGQAGLTQSAITRQVQGVEARLGLPLFERTTRSVVVTDAGKFLCRKARGSSVPRSREEANRRRGATVEPCSGWFQASLREACFLPKGP